MIESMQALHEQYNGILEPVGGKLLAKGYGDFAGELDAIARGLGILVLEPTEILLVRGKDAAKFLHGLTTNNINDLKPGQAGHQLLCATKGKIVHHVIVVRIREDNLAVICEPGEAGAVANHLEHYHIREEMELGRVELVRIDLLGPGAEPALAALNLPTGSIEGKFQQAPVLTPRLGIDALPQVMTLSPPAVAPALVAALLGTATGEAPSRLVGWEAFDEARIWAGIPRFGADYFKEFFPAEATLYDHITFNKGCYIGQETHARMHYRGHPNRKLVAIEMDKEQAAGLTSGGELYHEGNAVGSITSLARQAHDGRLRGIALVRFELIKEPGIRFATSEQGQPQVAWHPLSTDLGGKKT